MNLDCDEEGFVYFNDLLFKAMHLKHGEDRIRNKLLGEAEIKIRLKIKKLKL